MTSLTSYQDTEAHPTFTPTRMYLGEDIILTEKCSQAVTDTEDTALVHLAKTVGLNVL